MCRYLILGANNSCRFLLCSHYYHFNRIWWHTYGWFEQCTFFSHRLFNVRFDNYNEEDNDDDDDDDHDVACKINQCASIWSIAAAAAIVVSKAQQETRSPSFFLFFYFDEVTAAAANKWCEITILNVTLNFFSWTCRFHFHPM